MKNSKKIIVSSLIAGAFLLAFLPSKAVVSADQQKKTLHSRTYPKKDVMYKKLGTSSERANEARQRAQAARAAADEATGAVHTAVDAAGTAASHAAAAQAAADKAAELVRRQKANIY